MRYLLLLLLFFTGCQQLGESISLDEVSAKARSGDRKAIEQLVGLLSSEGELTNERVYSVLVSLNSAEVIPVLLGKVHSSDRIQREYVIAALGNHQAATAVKPIAEVLADRQLKRRYIAAWALGEIAQPDCVQPLLNALGDSDGEVRKAATRSLIKLNRLATEPLIDFLSHTESTTAAGAIRALGDIADPLAFEVLANRIKGANRAEVILALGKLKDSRSEPLLIEALQDADWQVRMNAAMALSEVGGAASIMPLETALQDDVNVVREWSARSLEMLTGKHYRYRNETGELVLPYNIYH
ncbi:HEAT repeat domain-containing protein [Malonomonas rubra]|uniref:HEAT repeat domain-containing protein n=1 Tax=Malonomonas rubra TaxID=57040 RepID=UPI0026E9DF50|nr:HEAT repeat domain-containing protein [Malonomonas rubra]